MQFVSTRGQAAPAGLSAAIAAGLAPDGGLYVPESLPPLSPADFQGRETLPEIAAALLRPFFEGDALAGELIHRGGRILASAGSAAERSANSGLIAFGVIAAAWQRGLKIGHGADCDLRVAGHDDHPLSEYACPPLTTVAQNYNEIGRLAIELLLRKLGGPDAALSGKDQILLKSELMLRRSA